MGPKIITLGEPLLEFNAQKAGRLKDNYHYEVSFGGDTSNFAIAASRAGAEVSYVTRIGDDEFGQMFLDLWQSEGIDIRSVKKEQNGRTGIYFISRKGKKHYFTYYRNDSAASHLCVNDVPKSKIENAKVFHTTGISQAISQSACDAVFFAMKVAKKANTLISYDPNIRPKLWDLEHAREVVWESIKLADFVLPSIEDAKLLTNLVNPYEIIERIINAGKCIVALKMGHDGVLLFDGNDVTNFPPVDVDVVDTTGAGDAFDGVFVAKCIQGFPLKKCAEYANIAAALTTTSHGAINSIPSSDQIEKLLFERGKAFYEL